MLTRESTLCWRRTTLCWRRTTVPMLYEVTLGGRSKALQSAGLTAGTVGRILHGRWMRQAVGPVAAGAGGVGISWRWGVDTRKRLVAQSRNLIVAGPCVRATQRMLSGWAGEHQSTEGPHA